MLAAHISFAAIAAVDLTETQANLLTYSVLAIAICIVGITLGALIAALMLVRAKNQATAAVQQQLRRAQPFLAAAQAKVEPILANTGDIVTDLKPKIRTISEDLAELSHMVRAQATDLDSTISDVTLKARSQVDRVNGMVNSTLDSTTNVVNNIERGIRVPIREVSGLFAGLKAALDVFFSRDGHTSPAGIVSREITRRVHNAAQQTQAAAGQRAREGYAAEARIHGVPSSSQRTVVEAGEESEVL